jgi:Ca-activated chloride channel homolog
VIADKTLNYGGGVLKYLQLKLTILILLFSSLSANADSLSAYAIGENKKGIKSFESQDVSGAQQSFGNALSAAPYAPELHYNLGLTLTGQGQVDAAKKSYNNALELTKKEDGNSDVKFRTYFNLGELAQKEKKVDEALAWYQKALNEKPDSKETKINIELLIQSQKSGGQGKDNQDKQDKKDDQNKDSKDGDGDKDKDKQEKPKPGEPPPKMSNKSKPQPQKFKSEELNQNDVNKILGELKQQEQKIRAEFNKRDVKERPRAKDW